MALKSRANTLVATGWKPVAQIVKEDGNALRLKVLVGEREDVIDLVYGVEGSVNVR